MATPLNLNTEGTHNDDNEQIKRDKNVVPRDPQQEQERDFQQIVNNNTDVDKDPTAYRNAGARGYTQREGEKNQLKNLHIGGSETSPQGANDHVTDQSKRQGSGFEAEGSFELDHEQNLRTREQPFGSTAPDGAAQPVQE
ncbi:hypothetical protein [Hymenobacter jeollabukensis]|uniref:Uncharacterized protein n=1 Tax=Hymenobacter jeollabukensis TaxID=2025313 RepID=A0A5R8WXC7_9BACT|nr:hypothetical protein [Hymenobacter jeollabukensis]TLM96713.1 hypothetical protein FDY95_01585 [Hymenobacter jeollabukensis]